MLSDVSTVLADGVFSRLGHGCRFVTITQSLSLVSQSEDQLSVY